jgi:hypothetical protein
MTERFDASRRSFIKSVGLGAAGAAMGLGFPSLGLAAEAKNGIPHRAFGKTGLKIPEIAFGAMDLTRDNSQVLRNSLTQALVLVDTAPNYTNGISEPVVGEMVKAFGRDKVLLLTKASGLKHAMLRTQSSAEVEKAVREKLEESLKRLQTDYVDAYVAPHGATDPADVDYPQLREVLEKLKKEGKIRFCGFSTHANYVACCAAAIDSGWRDFVLAAVAITTLDPEMLDLASKLQEEMSQKAGAAGKRPARQAAGGGKKRLEDSREIMAKAQKAGLGVIAMKAAKYVPADTLGEAVRKKFAPEGAPISHHQICYRYVLDQPFCSSVSIGMGAMQHLEEALQLPSLKLKTV